MTDSRFAELFPSRKPLIGMIHLPPLPDYADSPGITAIVDSALRDLRALAVAGFDGVLVENEYDRPHKVSASRETVAAMIEVTSEVVRASGDVVVGCQILLHDPQASLEVARAAGAEFIRTDYFVDRMTRAEYGEFSIDPAGLLEFRRSIDAGQVLVLADVQVKYATMVHPRPLGESAQEACEMGADGIVVTGDSSGDAPTVSQLREAARGVRAGGGQVPIIAGSGLNAENAAMLFGAADAAIVGTALMSNGAVNQARAAELAARVGSLK